MIRLFGRFLCSAFTISPFYPHVPPSFDSLLSDAPKRLNQQMYSLIFVNFLLFQNSFH